MNILKSMVNGASSQFGREFGRAAANKILKGSNYYAVKNGNNSNNIQQNVISSEWDGNTEIIEPEQKLMVHEGEKLGCFMLIFIFFCSGIPFLNIILMGWGVLSSIKIRKAYEYIIINNCSFATVWYNIKIADRRHKIGYRIERELRVTNDVMRPLLFNELNEYTKLYNRKKILIIYFGILFITSLSTTILIISLF